jgi:hypothetical protein
MAARLHHGVAEMRLEQVIEGILAKSSPPSVRSDPLARCFPVMLANLGDN